VFQYFDNTDAVTTSIPAIRRIRITIVAETENKDSLTNQVKTMTYTTDVLVKNHVLSHIW
jgi:D-arabinose 5-phosphate isomerase GutQ